MGPTTFRYIAPDDLIKHRFIRHPRPEWGAAVLCFRDEKGSRAVVQAFDARPVGYRVLYGLDEFADSPFVYAATLGRTQVGIVTRCLWGGPQAAILVEELAALGVPYIIGCGCGGSLRPEVARGAQMAAVAALCTDGTSRAYAPAEAVLVPDPSLLTLAQTAAHNLACDLHGVTVATVDALYRETESQVDAWQAAGAHAINMETGPLYAAAAACGVKSIWLGHVSDRLLKGHWDDWLIDREEMSRVSAALCLELVRSL